MINEDYVSFETAKLLKENGFDEPCEVWYAEYTSVWGGDSSGDRKYINIQFDDKNRFDKDYKFLCYAPTLQMAMKWLREVYNMHIEVKYFFEPHIYKYTITYTPVALDNISSHPQCFNTYEEACEAAIKYCLENLI